MASSLSRTLYRSLLVNHVKRSQLSLRFLANFSSSSETSSDSDDPAVKWDLPGSASDSTTRSSPPTPESTDRPLKDGLDVGIYKAILIGQVGQSPIEKKLRSGRTVTMLSVGTGGIRNNRRPLQNEDPMEYANRSMIQWHRVTIYPEMLGALAAKHCHPGAILYLEGNLETKIFNDPLTGLVRRVREIAIRRNGRMVFLGKGSGTDQTAQKPKGVGYY